jgi:hypothetical protein
LKKIRYISFILFFLLSAWAVAQERGEHLIPENDMLITHEETYIYYSKLRKYLIQDISDWKQLTVLIKPSFTAESLFCIDFDLKSRKYYMKSNIANNNIYNNDTVKTIRYKREIEKKSADLVVKLIDRVLQNTKYEIEEDYGPDGVTYSFSSQTKSGKTWSPNATSKMGRLVQIIETLTSATKSNSSKYGLSAEMERIIEDLICEI